MNILITGAYGQLGIEIDRAVRNLETVSNTYYYVGKDGLDVRKEGALEELCKRKNVTFDAVVNCAAYTNVDKAETDEGYEQAVAVNENGVRNLAISCNNLGTKLIHISTDYVFSGVQTFPYSPEQFPYAANNYGRTKLAGELAILREIEDYLIIRTSWLYSAYKTNFLTKMLPYLENDKLVYGVTDETSCPTSARSLAEFIVIGILEKGKDSKEFNLKGTYHFANDGVARRFDWICAIKKIIGSNSTIIPITSRDFYATMNGTFAERPKYTVLDTLKTRLDFSYQIPYWEDELKDIILSQCLIQTA